MTTETFNIVPSWFAFTRILGMYLQSHMPDEQQATLYDMLRETEKMAELADKWVEHCEIEDTKSKEADKAARGSRDTLTSEERLDEIRSDHAKRKEAWLRDPDSGAEYLRLVLGTLIHKYGPIEAIVLSDEEGETEGAVHVNRRGLITSTEMDHLIGYLYEVDGPVALKLTRGGQSPYVLHCLFDISNEAEEIIYDYNVSDAVDAAIGFASKNHSTTRDYYVNGEG